MYFTPDSSSDVRNCPISEKYNNLKDYLNSTGECLLFVGYTYPLALLTNSVHTPPPLSFLYLTVKLHSYRISLLLLLMWTFLEY